MDAATLVIIGVIALVVIVAIALIADRRHKQTLETRRVQAGEHRDLAALARAEADHEAALADEHAARAEKERLAAEQRRLTVEQRQAEAADLDDRAQEMDPDAGTDEDAAMAERPVVEEPTDSRGR
jgi:FtsZ-interacting cell division protein ZipA